MLKYILKMHLKTNGLTLTPIILFLVISLLKKAQLNIDGDYRNVTVNSNKANISDFGRIKKLNMFNSDFYVFSYYTQKENSYALFSDEFNIENSSVHLYLGNILKGYQINISDSNIIVDFNLLEKEKSSFK
ncbi:hypothetical protein Q7489_07985 [Glaesserella parasuis]|nr:hypothetical protein [Glaesserella parasuis]